MKNSEKLQADIVDELAFDPKVDSSEVAVTVTSEGVVTLAGGVPSYAQKRAAEWAVKRVAGVRAVANDIEVRSVGHAALADTEIAEAALHALQWSTSIPSDRIKVTVAKGWVTLDGQVDWQFQKTSAYEVVRDLLGVRGVNNDIMVKPSVRASDVKGKIESAFKRSAQIDADHVKVKTEGGKVTLTGTVRSWSERDEAENAAWAAPGVTGVINLLEVKEVVFA